MSYRIETDYKKIDNAEWDDFVKNHPKGNYFQTYNFVKINEGVGKYNPFAVAIYGEDSLAGIVAGIIQKEDYSILSFMTARAIIIGGPLILNDNKEILNELLEYLNRYLKSKSIYTEFRNLKDLSKLKDVFKVQGFLYEEHLNFLVACSDMETLKKKMSKSKIRQIKKSLKNGAEVIANPSLEQVEEFYLILKTHYKLKVKKPLPDWVFFKRYFDQKGLYLLIEYERKIIGGMMCPIYGQKEIYELYICGLDNEYKEIFPSVLATWAAIDFANINGIQYFNFMGAGKPDQDYGVREFKSKFGGELVNYGRYKTINQPLFYFFSKFAFMIWQKIK
jgi:serine/alanine adding enzyme